jgi:N-acetyl-gamma-glutamyl-phosphate reductase
MNAKNKIKVAISGVTGYTGAVLTSLLVTHPMVEIKYLCSAANVGRNLKDVYPALINYSLPDKMVSHDGLPYEELDCLFTATPNGTATQIVSKVIESGCKLIDLAADFRLKTQKDFTQWYAPLNPPPQNILDQSVYGLTELNRDEIVKAQILANPGCYVTASSLALIPLLKNNLIDSNTIIIDAKSGITGAGKKADVDLLYSETAESFSAYKITGHRHTPEIEQNLKIFGGVSTKVKFTPHLLPIKRGILATIYAKPKASFQSIKECLQATYSNEEFVKIVDHAPKTKDVYGSNRCHIYCEYDERSDILVLVSVIDNLMKGAAGQAVQNFNLMFNINENLGLSSQSVLP